MHLLLVSVVQQGVQGVRLPQQLLLFGWGRGRGRGLGRSRGRRGLLEPLAQDVLELELRAHGVLGPAGEGLEDVALSALLRTCPVEGH